MKELKQLEKLINELNLSNSSNDKKKVLEGHPECQELLKWVYDPYKVYNVTSENVKKLKEIEPEKVDVNMTIFDLLDKLDKREITGHQAIGIVKGFIQNNKEHEETIYLILDRNLKTRTNAKLINKVFKKLVPGYEVALAHVYDDYADKVDFIKDRWLSSRKLDGIRVNAIIKDDDVVFKSREGKIFTTLSKVKEAILKCKQLIKISNKIGGIVLDGEMCIVDKYGNEDFQSIIKLIRRKDFTIDNPKYKIFDILTYKNFMDEEKSKNLSERLNIIEEYKSRGEFDGGILHPVEFILIRDQSHFEVLKKEAAEKNWEGLIIRKDVPYEAKRTKNMLKVKEFIDAEFKVTEAVMGMIRYIVKGKEIEEEMLSAITIMHKGYPVSVGSGFSIDFRKECYKDPSKIVGKTVCVKYFEETKNENGTISLRFPTVKHIYEEERDC